MFQKISWNLILVVISVFSNIYMYSKIFKLTNDSIREIETLRVNNVALERMLTVCESQLNKRSEPSIEYEKKRRKIRTTIQYLWESVKYNTMVAIKENNSKTLLNLLVSAYEHKITFLSDWKIMSNNDGYGKWRQEEANRLSEILQKRFSTLMNPKNCDEAKYFRCFGEWACGWGCQHNQYVACFAVAYGMNRKLIFNKFSQQFYEIDEYERYYEAIPQSCIISDPKVLEVEYPGTNESKIIKSPDKLRGYTPRIQHLLLNLPEDLATRMDKVFEEPTAWWVSEITKFILKMKPETLNAINEAKEKLHYKNPIVGVHIRRGNKNSEAAYQSVEDYMSAVDGYFDQLELSQTVDKRRVYLSTDDPNLIEEIKKRYRNYEVIYNKDASNVATAYQQTGISSLGILIDIQLLAMSDFFVGTFSSNVGRRVFEYMYSTNIDAYERVFSLDNCYFEFGEVRQKYKVIIRHKPRNKFELAANIGDILEPQGSIITVLDMHGHMPMINRSTERKGLVPSFKLEKIIETAKFPTYDIY